MAILDDNTDYELPKEAEVGYDMSDNKDEDTEYDLPVEAEVGYESSQQDGDTDYELPNEALVSELGNDAYEPPKEDLTYEQFKQSPELVAAAMRFAKNRLGYDTINEEDAIDETIEHFRQFKVNELTAGKDWNYTSALATDGKRDEINDYKSLYRATESLEDFAGGVATTLGDYGGGIITAPSTLLGLLLPGGGKLAGVAAQQLAKLGVGKAIGALAANPIKTIASVEIAGAVAQDLSAQKTLVGVEEKDDMDFGQTLINGVVAGAGSALVSSIPLYLVKKYGTRGISKFAQTDDLLNKSQKAIDAKIVKADEAAAETISTKSVEANKIKERYKALNEENVAAGGDIKKGIADTQGIDVPLRVAVAPDKIDRLTAASVDILASGGGLKSFTRVTNKGDTIVEQERITEAISRVIRDATEGGDDAVSKALADDFGKTLNKYNLTSDDFANVFMSEFSEAGRLLQKAGQSKAQLRKLLSAMDDTVFSDIFSLNDNVVDVFKKSRDALKKDGKDSFLNIFDNGAIVGSLRNLDALRLASMTSQVGTTVRNTVGGYSRVGFDVLNQAFDEGIQRSVSLLKGEKSTQTFKESAQNIFSVAYGLINKEQSIAVESIFAMGFQNKASKLFRQLADLEDLTGVGLKGKKQPPTMLSNLTTRAGRNLNVLNTLSDNMFKRAAFMGNLTRELNKIKRIRLSQGKKVAEGELDMISIMKEGRFNEVFGTKGGQKALDRAVEDSLYFTYQASPKSPMGNLLVQGANKLPFLTTSVVPFPRFLANAMRFTYEYSPIYLAFSSKVRSELARTAGKEVSEEFGVRSYTETAKGLTGLGFMFGAVAFRKSEHSGEKWYEGRSSSGETYSLLPFFPAAPYLFFAYLWDKYDKGEEVFDKKTFKESIQAVTGMQMGKAGFGLYAMDKLVDDLGGVLEGDDDEAALYAAKKLGTEFISNIISTYTMPLTPLQDTYNTFYAPDDERIMRDNNIEDLSSLIIAKSLARVPGNYYIEKLLKEAYGTEYEIPKAYQSPAKKGLTRRFTPISRQLTGRLYSEKKIPVEKELDRLRITRSQVMKRTGVSEADALLGWYMGEYMVDIVQPFIKTKLYKNLPEKIKKARLLEEIVRVRKSVVETARDTIVYRNNNIKTRPMTRVRFLKLPKIYRKIAMDTYHERFGEPTTLKDYDYEALYKLAKQLSKTKLRNIEFQSVNIVDELNEEDGVLDNLND